VRSRLVGALVVAVMTLTACSSQSAGTPTGPGGSPVPDPPKARITATPAVDSKDAPVTDPVKISVADGTLTDVAVTNQDGKALAGKLAADKLSWTSSETLGYGKTYTYAAKATGPDNRTAELKGKFTTLNPAKQVRATVNPIDNATVGVGMPVSLKFDSPPKDRAAVQKALKITTSKGDVEGSWAWLSAAQVDFRPKVYWPANITVTVTPSSTACRTATGRTASPTCPPSSPSAAARSRRSTRRTTTWWCTATAPRWPATRPATAGTTTRT